MGFWVLEDERVGGGGRGSGRGGGRGHMCRVVGVSPYRGVCLAVGFSFTEGEHQIIKKRDKIVESLLFYFGCAQHETGFCFVDLRMRG